MVTDEDEFQFSKSLEEFLVFHNKLQAGFKGFDFESKGIQLSIKFPTNHNELEFYLSNYLPYELQRYTETVSRIPFIVKSSLFKDFFISFSKGNNQ